jgi:hypothetical protein
MGFLGNTHFLPSQKIPKISPQIFPGNLPKVYKSSSTRLASPFGQPRNPSWDPPKNPSLNFP